MLAPDTILQGRYRIIRQLGRGGMGAVYEALDSRVSSLVAVKETFAATDEHREAFEREAKLLANLDHEAFPRVTDHFFDGEGQYLVMELVRGDDLWKLMQTRETPFPVEMVLQWADQLLDALDELHHNNPPIIHRDLKSANLKLTPKGKIKLLDFGIAKGAVGEMTFHTSDPLSVFGYTPHFAPLEQTLRSDRRWLETFEMLNPDAVAAILASPTDPRSDLYSLGATLYHLLTKQVPTDATTRASFVWSGRPDPLATANSLNSQVSPAVSAVLQRSMALVREDRPLNAAAMRQALHDASLALPDSLPPTIIHPDDEQTRAANEAETRRLAIEEARPAEAERLRSEGEEGEGRERAERERREKDHDEEAQLPDADRPAIDAEAEGQRLAPGPTVAGQTLAAPASPIIAPRLLGLPVRPPDSFAAGLSRVQGTDADNEKHSSTAKVIGIVAASVIAIALLIGGFIWWNGTGAVPGSTANQTASGDLEFVSIVPGSFMMGSPANEAGRSEGEGPQHQVTISKAFELGKYEVTQVQWQVVMGSNPSNFNGCDQCPVERVSWDDVQGFITKLNARNDGHNYRLPTEAEWEYAARAGTTGPYAGNLDEVAWYFANSGGKPHPVGQKQPNAWGLHDMHGNVFEWVQDWFGPYEAGAQVDPIGPSSGSDRGGRGGSWGGTAPYARAAARLDFEPGYRGGGLGFRVARSQNSLQNTNTPPSANANSTPLPNPEPSGNPEAQTADRRKLVDRRDALIKRKQRLLLTYNEEWPEVKQLTAQIEELNRSIAALDKGKP